MAKQLITIGTPGAGGGEPAHAAFNKINDNTNEVYSFLGADGSGNLTPEGAREALNTYPKDEVYSKGEVYSKDEVENLVENSGFASLGANTFTGLQKMEGGAEVSGNFTVNGKNTLLNQATRSIFYSGDPSRLKNTLYYNGDNLRIITIYFRQGSVSADQIIKVDGTTGAAGNNPGGNYSLTAVIPPRSNYHFSASDDSQYWTWIEVDLG